MSSKELRYAHYGQVYQRRGFYAWKKIANGNHCMAYSKKYEKWYLLKRKKGEYRFVKKVTINQYGNSEYILENINGKIYQTGKGIVMKEIYNNGGTIKYFSCKSSIDQKLYKCSIGYDIKVDIGYMVHIGMKDDVNGEILYVYEKDRLTIQQKKKNKRNRRVRSKKKKRLVRNKNHMKKKKESCCTRVVNFIFS